MLGRYLRMTGKTVLHAMGFDAFGLPAEQYAVQTGTHPRKTTEDNILRYKAQLRQLGLGHDERRSVATTDVVPGVEDLQEDPLRPPVVRLVGGRAPVRGGAAGGGT